MAKMQDHKHRTNLGFNIGQMFKLEAEGPTTFSSSLYPQRETGHSESPKRGSDYHRRYRRSSNGQNVESSQNQTAMTSILKKETNIDAGELLPTDVKEQYNHESLNASFPSFMGEQKTYDNGNVTAKEHPFKTNINAHKRAKTRQDTDNLFGALPMRPKRDLADPLADTNFIMGAQLVKRSQNQVKTSQMRNRYMPQHMRSSDLSAEMEKIKIIHSKRNQLVKSHCSKQEENHTSKLGNLSLLEARQRSKLISELKQMISEDGKMSLERRNVTEADRNISSINIKAGQMAGKMTSPTNAEVEEEGTLSPFKCETDNYLFNEIKNQTSGNGFDQYESGYTSIKSQLDEETANGASTTKNNTTFTQSHLTTARIAKDSCAPPERNNLLKMIQMNHLYSNSRMQRERQGKSSSSVMSTNRERNSELYNYCVESQPKITQQQQTSINLLKKQALQNQQRHFNKTPLAVKQTRIEPQLIDDISRSQTEQRRKHNQSQLVSQRQHEQFFTSRAPAFLFDDCLSEFRGRDGESKYLASQSTRRNKSQMNKSYMTDQKIYRDIERNIRDQEVKIAEKYDLLKSEKQKWLKEKEQKANKCHIIPATEIGDPDVDVYRNYQNEVDKMEIYKEENDLEAEENNEQAKLYFDTAEAIQTQNGQGAKGEAIAFIISKLKKCMEAQNRLFEKQNTKLNLLYIESKNVIKSNLTLNYQNIILKTNQSEYLQIINQAKAHENYFINTHEAAQEFLKSQTLQQIAHEAELSEQEYRQHHVKLEIAKGLHQLMNARQRTFKADVHKLDLPEENEIYKSPDIKSTQQGILKSLQDHLFPPEAAKKKLNRPGPPERLLEQSTDDKTNSMIQRKLKNLEFSDVTRQLESVLDRLHKTMSSDPLMQSGKMESTDTAFSLFAEELKDKVQDLQHETARRVLQRMQKDISFEDQGIQVGEKEIDDELRNQINGLVAAKDALESRIEGLQRQIEDKDKEYDLLQERNTKLMAVNRVQSEAVKQLDNEAQEAKELASQCQAQQFEADKKILEYDKDLTFWKKKYTKLSTDGPSYSNSHSPTKGKNTQLSLVQTEQSKNQDSRDQSSASERISDGSCSGRGSNRRSSRQKESKKAAGQNNIKNQKLAGRSATQEPSILVNGKLEQNHQKPTTESSVDSSASKRRKSKNTHFEQISEDSGEQLPTTHKTRKHGSNAKSKSSSHEGGPAGYGFKSSSERKKQDIDTIRLNQKHEEYSNLIQDVKLSAKVQTKGRNADPEKELLRVSSQNRSSMSGESTYMQGKYNGAGGHVSKKKTKNKSQLRNDRGDGRYASDPEAAALQVSITKGVAMVDAASQYDMDIFFEYIFNFLKVIEERIQDGQILTQLMKNSPEQYYQSLELEIRKSKDKLLELQQILGKISSFRNKHGDVLFKGIAQSFTQNPVIPDIKQNMENRDLYQYSQATSPSMSNLQSSRLSPHKHEMLGYPQHILDFRAQVPGNKSQKKKSRRL